jgi:membrane protein implicated in regulation of membrane protease activity
MQTRLSSLVEALLNIGSGFVLSLVVGQLVYPMFGFPVSVGANVQITLIFTVISIVRSYLWRRWFNKRLTKQSIK